MSNAEEEDERLSSNEEDTLDGYLMGDIYEDEEADGDYEPDSLTMLSQSTYSSESSQERVSLDPLYRGHIYWKDHTCEDSNTPDARTVAFKPQRPPGIQLGRLGRTGIKDFRVPMDFLQMFLTNVILIGICIATNAYAEASIQRGENVSYTSSDGTWERIIREELCRFLGIVLYMSVVKFQTLDRYWSTNSLYSNSPVQKVMSRRRFQAILSFLQVTPPADIDHKADKLTRIRSLIDRVRKTSKELYQPGGEIAVDERMVSSKHRFSGIRQFMKDKPCRFGLKLWVLACNMTGYTYDFLVYLGKKRTEFADKTKTLSFNVTTTLCSPLYNQGYRIFTDCFYTSLTLGKELLANRIYMIGVLKSNSQSIPEELKNWKEWDKVSSRGDFRWHREGDFVYVQWKDCKVVTFMSPLHRGSELTNCERTVKSRSNWAKRRVSQPVIAQDYNKCMGAVDLSNQYLNKYPSYLYIRTQQHWWKVLFFHMLDIRVVNSLIIYNEFVEKYREEMRGIPVCTGQLEYRESLAFDLMRVGNCDIQELPKQKCFAEYISKRMDCIFCNAEALYNKLKPPSYKTSICCKGCVVPLCLTKDRNCFKKGHLKEFEHIRSNASKCCRKRKLDE